MSAVLIDYGCHSFTYRLASRLRSQGFPIRYFANGSLESPNCSSLPAWQHGEPDLIRIIRCRKPYGKVSLIGRLKGELEWAGQCTRALEQERPSVIVGSCIPLAALTRIQNWALRRRVSFVYWLQDIQGRAIHDLLGRALGFPGRVLGSFAYIWEQHMIDRSQMAITIARGHERELPHTVRCQQRFALLENWANVEEIPVCSRANDWAALHGLDKSLNIIYSGTLGLKHDLGLFLQLAKKFCNRQNVRIVVVSSGQAAERLQTEALKMHLTNLTVLPFQDYRDLPQVLGSAAVLIAPLDASAGKFCVPSKILSYFCAGRPTVIAISRENPAASMIERAQAGLVVQPGNSAEFIAAVTRLIDNQELRNQAGQSARAYAERTFSLDNVVPRFLQILRSAGVAANGLPSQPVPAAVRAAS